MVFAEVNAMDSLDFEDFNMNNLEDLPSEFVLSNGTSDVRKICELAVNEIIELALNCIIKQDMADTKDVMQTEVTLLNANQQIDTGFEVELKLKEELLVKTQSEVSKYKQEVEKLEAKLANDLNISKKEEDKYRKIMEEYEKIVAEQFSKLTKLEEEHDTVKRHLANLEIAFSDVHQKYERAKVIINGYTSNEITLRESLATLENNLQKNEQKYESLKSHAKAQIEKANEEFNSLREQHDLEVHKLNAIVKRLEIKVVSLDDLLDQKTKECKALASLCDEVTGRVE